MLINNKMLLEILQENIKQEDALKKIYDVINDRREDEHGNSETAQNRLDRIVSKTQAALAEAGYNVYRLDNLMEYPEQQLDELINIPKFVKERP